MIDWNICLNIWIYQCRVWGFNLGIFIETKSSLMNADLDVATLELMNSLCDKYDLYIV